MKFQKSKFTNYHESETLIDRIAHKSAVLKAIHSKKFDRFILCEQDQAKKFIVAKKQNFQGT